LTKPKYPLVPRQVQFSLGVPSHDVIVVSSCVLTLCLVHIVADNWSSTYW
jgi:hypothetical protein